MSIPPFVRIQGRSYLVVNFDLDSELPSTLVLLETLLQHHSPEGILLLRPLTLTEERLLQRVKKERDAEAWAQVVVKDEGRFRGR